MYQFYYADETAPLNVPPFQQNIRNRFSIAAVRPAMWEEHCLECSAPACFESCLHYLPRSDGRCMRFENGLRTFSHEAGCLGQGVRVTFRKWANMMTVLFPAMLPQDDYAALAAKNQKLGNGLKKLANSPLPRALRWQGIRTAEYLRRRTLRNLTGIDNAPDAFLFHAWSHRAASFRLIVEVFDDHTSVFRLSIPVAPGENMTVIPAEKLSPECGKAGNLVKVYPENDIEAELDILWCDFVKGSPIAAEVPAAQVKCVVWDLDNTLWNGILIETDDPAALALRPRVAETIRALDERGVIQSIASKNDYDQAWPALERLGLSEYFLYPQIHWNAKSASITQIAQSLNIGIDSLALIDDSDFERRQVRSALPQVRVYAETEVDDLLSYPEFQMLVTEESCNRRAMYRAEEKRHQLMAADNGDTIAFLQKCHLRADIFTPAGKEELLRCYELVVRTNQLNMSGNKYTPEEFEAVLARPGHTNFAFSCRDDFGEYGIVGFGQYRVENGTMVFTEFAMSCRVAGKYVESAVFSALLEKEGLEKGLFPVIKTKKNILLRRTLGEIGFAVGFDEPDKISYHFSTALHLSSLVAVVRSTTYDFTDSR